MPVVSGKNTGQFGTRRPGFHNYKSRNILPMETKLGDTVYLATLTLCLLVRFATFASVCHASCNIRENGASCRPVSPQEEGNKFQHIL
jgi:hypothetical protein